LLILLGLALVFAFDDSTLFTAWKAQYNKQYSTAEEESLRFENFKLSIDRVQSRNAKSGSTTFGLTKFADMTPEEFKSTLLGYIRPAEKSDVGVLTPQDIDVPQTLDWRNQNMVTPVKNQEQCGSCWAFSVTENIESMYCMKNQIDCTTFPPLSPQEIVDCDTVDQGCDGGDPPTAYQFVIQEGGMEDASDYPYTAQDGTCNFQANLVKVTISSWQYATQNSDETTMQNNLASWGPLSICVHAEPWQDYTGGVLMASDCSNQLDHCVQLVGYDMTQSTPFWIVRNSWGTDWGENGYIRLQYGQDTCGCADEATSAII
jgi:C1A family cysteine protease